MECKDQCLVLGGGWILVWPIKVVFVVFSSLQLANPCLLTLYHLLWCILKEPGTIKHYATIHIAHIKHCGKLFPLQFLTIYALLLCTGTCLLLSVLMFCAAVHMCKMLKLFLNVTVMNHDFTPLPSMLIRTTLKSALPSHIL